MIKARTQGVALAVMLLLLIFLILFSIQTPQEVRKERAGYTLQALYHFIGGFSIETPDQVANAAVDGVQVDLKYGDPYTPNDPVGMALQERRMKLIDAIPETYLYYYEPVKYYV